MFSFKTDKYRGDVLCKYILRCFLRFQGQMLFLQDHYKDNTTYYYASPKNIKEQFR